LLLVDTPAEAASARERSKSDKVNDPIPNAPTRKKSRRVEPAQFVRSRGYLSSSMIPFLIGETEGKTSRHIYLNAGLKRKNSPLSKNFYDFLQTREKMGKLSLLESLISPFAIR
jgi:hypothetical protein